VLATAARAVLAGTAPQNLFEVLTNHYLYRDKACAEDVRRACWPVANELSRLGDLTPDEAETLREVFGTAGETDERIAWKVQKNLESL
jgi:hypothetical protein